MNEKKNKSRKIQNRILNVIIVLCLMAALGFAGKYFYDIHVQKSNAEQALVVADKVIDSKKDIRKEPIDIGTVIGRMSIDGLIPPTPILEGDDLALALNHGIGRITSTRMPGTGVGVVALSAHRETFFAPLRDAKIGDIVKVEMPYGTFNYKITDSFVVNPDQGEKVYSEEGLTKERLVLITCYPFNNFLPPNQRAIFFADLID